MSSETQPSKRFSGISSSPGVAIGEVYLLFRDELPIPRLKVPEVDQEREVRRFEQAVKEVTSSLNHLSQDLKRLPHREPYMIVQAHLALLRDPLLIKGTKEKIRRDHINAEWALRLTWKELESQFQSIPHEYLRGRVEDVQHLYRRLIQSLLGHSPYPIVPEDAILVAHTLSAEDVLRYSQARVKGFICETGSPLSHPSILARMLQIPMVVGVHNLLSELEGGEPAILDAHKGELIIHPPEDMLREYDRRLKQERGRISPPSLGLAEEVLTRDGVICTLMANIDTPEEAVQARSLGAKGIGLVRTELPFLGRDTPPALDELSQIYRAMIQAMDGLPVTFRLLDLGGDKVPRFLNREEEENPALGLRGIRLCLRHPELLELQVRAILRASRDAPVRVLVPMIATVSELKMCVRIIEEISQEEGVPTPPIGAMIETPACALIMDALAADADFFSIGSNDLIQYTMAMDRTNEAVSYLYAPLHLGIMRLLHEIIRNAQKLGKPISICGEMAAEPCFVYLLLGMGIREFSMLPAAIPVVGRFLRHCDTGKAKRGVQRLFHFSTVEEREEYLRAELKRIVPEVDFHQPF